MALDSAEVAADLLQIALALTIECPKSLVDDSVRDEKVSRVCIM